MDTISNDEMIKYVKAYSNRFKSFIKKLSPEELNVLMSYKHKGYYRINNVLNDNQVPFPKSMLPTFYKDKFLKQTAEEIVQSIHLLDDIFDKVPKTIQTKIPNILYRGSQSYSSNLKVDTTIITRGFISTTLVPYVASHFIGCHGCCLFKLLINKPLPHIYLSWYTATNDPQESIAHSELEILLPRNLIFKIVKVEKVSLDSNHIFCTQKDIQQSKTKKLTLYTCEFVDEIKERTIPAVKFSIES